MGPEPIQPDRILQKRSREGSGVTARGSYRRDPEGCDCSIFHTTYKFFVGRLEPAERENWTFAREYIPQFVGAQTPYTHPTIHPTRCKQRPIGAESCGGDPVRMALRVQ